MLRALLRLDRENEYCLFIDAASYVPSDLPAGARHVVVRTSEAPASAASSSGRRSLPDILRMTRAVLREPLDLFFFPTVYTWFPLLTRARIIVGIHDTIAEDFPDIIFPGGKGKRFWKWKSALARRQADLVMTVSDHARRAIIRSFGHRPERVVVVGEAPDPVFRRLEESEIDRRAITRYGVPEGPFLIYVGGINPHKNLPALIDALGELRRVDGDASLETAKLVIVGELESERFTPGLEQVRERIEALGLGDDVVLTGYVPDGDLVQLLNAATALVLPSLAEGFGLPAVEAAACGTPVIATRNSPLPEILGAGGIFIDPLSPNELREALRRIMTDPEARRMMGVSARACVAPLSWDASARQLLDLFRRAGEPSA